MGAVQLFLTDARTLAGREAESLPWLTEKRREEAGSFQNEEARLLHCAAGLLLRRVLCVTKDEELVIGPMGKPSLACGGVEFSLSHAGRYAALAVGDSAVCTNPNAEQLASIAISACDTVRSLLDWEPRCALGCYSTRGNGQGELIDKVIEATKIANEQRPDLTIEGELQLDAAIVPAVAEKKVKGESRVAGKANVVIWPDLNVGNIAVKLIQQFGRADAYGPMLQGFQKVVCDCSRGAPVSEIKGNVVISAVRAAGMKK